MEDIEDQDRIKWTAPEASKILDIPLATVYQRARSRGFIQKKRGWNNKGYEALYSDADIESMRVDLRGRQQNAKK